MPNKKILCRDDYYHKSIKKDSEINKGLRRQQIGRQEEKNFFDYYSKKIPFLRDVSKVKEYHLLSSKAFKDFKMFYNTYDVNKGIYEEFFEEYLQEFNNNHWFKKADFIIKKENGNVLEIEVKSKKTNINSIRNYTNLFSRNQKLCNYMKLKLTKDNEKLQNKKTAMFAENYELQLKKKIMSGFPDYIALEENDDEFKFLKLREDDNILIDTKDLVFNYRVKKGLSVSINNLQNYTLLTSEQWLEEVKEKGYI